jgi:branched-chain amino acid aminotransferase
MTIDKKYLVYDGVLYADDAPLLKTTNRGFRFGDGLFETIRYHKGVPLFLADHYERLIRGMAVLHLSVQGFPSRQEFLDRIISLVNKNRLFGDVRVRITVFRKGEGLYTPPDLQASWLIEVASLPDQSFVLNEKGLAIDIFTEFPKLPSPISPFKTIASLPYVLAGLHCKEQKQDDCLLQNGQGKIIESISSNLFLIKGQTVYTPGIGSGCIDGIMRKQIIAFLPELGFHLIETPGFTVEELLDADEIFLTNSISGIRWVVGYGEKRFFGIKVRKIFKRMLALLTVN